MESININSIKNLATTLNLLGDIVRLEIVIYL